MSWTTCTSSSTQSAITASYFPLTAKWRSTLRTMYNTSRICRPNKNLLLVGSSFAPLRLPDSAANRIRHRCAAIPLLYLIQKRLFSGSSQTGEEEEPHLRRKVRMLQPHGNCPSSDQPGCIAVCSRYIIAGIGTYTLVDQPINRVYFVFVLTTSKFSTSFAGR